MQNIVKGLIVVLFFFVFSAQAFAADVLITGKLTDSKSNPIGMGSVAFMDQQNKTVAASSTDSNGAYSVMIPQGTYSIEAAGPEGSNLPKATLKDQVFNSGTIKDIVLSAEVKGATTRAIPWLPIIIIAVIIAAVIGFILIRRQNSSSL
jgi:hypothetical protein